MIHDEQKNPADEKAAPVPKGAQPASRGLISRRALVRAGWTVPVVMALHIPVNAVAQYACSHTDVSGTAHEDVAVDGVHEDIDGTAHTDAEVCD